MLLYPVYAVLFAEHGLSPAQISSLFIIWSVTAFALEVPSGLWADRFSRRRLVVAAPLLAGAGFALWTFLPGYLSFALGFVLWGAGGAMRSGALQALVYEELARLGATASYARLIGRSEALGYTAALAATALAAPVTAAGGYTALGVASVAATVLAALAARALPESRGGAAERGDGYLKVLTDGLGEVRRSPPVLRSAVLVAALMGVGALDEYVPLLAAATGVAAAVVPLLVLMDTAGATLGGWLAGRGARWTAPALAAAAVCLAAGAASGHPAGMALVAVASGVFQWATANADAGLQDRVPDRTRATVTSIAGFGSEVVAVLFFASYAVGSAWAGPGQLLALAALPYLLVAVAIGWSRRRRRGQDGG
ncbi:MFS transporter [Sphaerisporangium sp. TRM90804]|uniref:MFS transporter n=1 Tax=Sphaerisporangium sp. TRM90804 TaxID=3031113 RepID=UPI00244A9C9F|nr:MFS transporter [Sphaerisporangium sp. TRM90804]MDH2425846.1 MFS transporter [Sphaerisporangium sp. TRM90804]